MNAHAPIVAGELVDDFNQFFPPVSTDLVSELAARYQAQRSKIMLYNDGRLVAILPASARGKDVLPGFNHEWSKVYSNEFAGTSVSVMILTATKP